MVRDRERVLRIRDAVRGGLIRVSRLKENMHAAHHAQFDLVDHLFEHIDTFCLKLLANEQRGTFEQESRWLDNADRMIDLAAASMESLEKMYGTDNPAQAAGA